jgi:hypothetical protein
MSEQETAVLQSLLKQFPAQTNGENILGTGNFLAGNREFYLQRNTRRMRFSIWKALFSGAAFVRANPEQDEIIPRRRQNVAADRRRPARM